MNLVPKLGHLQVSSVLTILTQKSLFPTDMIQREDRMFSVRCETQLSFKSCWKLLSRKSTLMTHFPVVFVAMLR